MASHCQLNSPECFLVSGSRGRSTSRKVCSLDPGTPYYNIQYIPTYDRRHCKEITNNIKEWEMGDSNIFKQLHHSLFLLRLLQHSYISKSTLLVHNCAVPSIHCNNKTQTRSSLCEQQVVQIRCLRVFCRMWQQASRIAWPIPGGQLLLSISFWLQVPLNQHNGHQRPEVLFLRP